MVKNAFVSSKAFQLNLKLVVAWKHNCLLCKKLVAAPTTHATCKKLVAALTKDVAHKTLRAKAVVRKKGRPARRLNTKGKTTSLKIIKASNVKKVRKIKSRSKLITIIITISLC